MNQFSFQPDLVVEVTSFCDRQCSGCYAPNTLVSKENMPILAKKNFLSLATLIATLKQITPTENIETIAVRGGQLREKVQQET